MNPFMIDHVSNVAFDKPVIVALDFPDEKSTLHFVRQLSPDLCRLKIGKELFTASGRSLVESLVMQGFELFLDLKYHDIPNTVAAACKVAAKMGVWMVDMHASGGQKMMQAAKDAIANEGHQPLLIGVTVLTSMAQDDLTQIGYLRSVTEQVLHLATLTQKSGLDGVVCSALEAAMIREHLGKDFILVTPGIRLSLEQNQDDQKRIMTPQAAISAGSSYLVVGRPITQASDPVAVLQQINQQIQMV